MTSSFAHAFTAILAKTVSESNDERVRALAEPGAQESAVSRLGALLREWELLLNAPANAAVSLPRRNPESKTSHFDPPASLGQVGRHFFRSSLFDAAEVPNPLLPPDELEHRRASGGDVGTGPTSMHARRWLMTENAIEALRSIERAAQEDAQRRRATRLALRSGSDALPVKKPRAEHTDGRVITLSDYMRAAADDRVGSETDVDVALGFFEACDFVGCRGEPLALSAEDCVRFRDSLAQHRTSSSSHPPLRIGVMTTVCTTAPRSAMPGSHSGLDPESLGRRAQALLGSKSVRSTKVGRALLEAVAGLDEPSLDGSVSSLEAVVDRATTTMQFQISGAVLSEYSVGDVREIDSCGTVSGVAAPIVSTHLCRRGVVVWKTTSSPFSTT